MRVWGRQGKVGFVIIANIVQIHVQYRSYGGFSMSRRNGDNLVHNNMYYSKKKKKKLGGGAEVLLKCNIFHLFLFARSYVFPFTIIYLTEKSALNE